MGGSVGGIPASVLSFVSTKVLAPISDDKVMTSAPRACAFAYSSLWISLLTHIVLISAIVKRVDSNFTEPVNMAVFIETCFLARGVWATIWDPTMSEGNPHTWGFTPPHHTRGFTQHWLQHLHQISGSAKPKLLGTQQDQRNRSTVNDKPEDA